MPVVGVAGRCLIDQLTWENVGFATVLTTTDAAGSVESSLAAPGPALQRIGRRLGRSLHAATRHTVGHEGPTKESPWLSTR